jgi:hypothetical protein
MKNLGLALIVCGLLLGGCNTAPHDPTVAARAYAPYDNYYGRVAGRQPISADQGLSRCRRARISLALKPRSQRRR